MTVLSVVVLMWLFPRGFPVSWFEVSWNGGVTWEVLAAERSIDHSDYTVWVYSADHPGPVRPYLLRGCNALSTPQCGESVGRGGVPRLPRTVRGVVP